MSDLTEALARGLFFRDQYQFPLGDSDLAWGALRMQYRRDVERFLLPEIQREES